MPSRILVPSLTAPSVPLGTHNPSTSHRAYHEKPSALHHRWSMFGYLNGLRKGIASLKKNQLKSEPVHRRVSSTISLFGPTPVPDLTPNNSSFVFSPPSPTLATPASVSCGVDASIPWITVSNAEVRRVPFPSLKNQSPVISFAPDAENFSKPPKQQVSVSGCSKPSSVAAAPPPVRVLRPQLMQPPDCKTSVH
ncbi:hypothetical protein B0F90DRAFT_1818365 [Multifurca ochricompacta]|uniref:Uncharacterized protein n=1 Tax=Multifurca ochricompacta TaxID=376703 RepID=A0AAD4M482_9AGAM|nr:hypothetical protein B0F90DRAFT_1818365 [Multifurca ochricompacta]